jgi:hypothetical protein
MYSHSLIMNAVLITPFALALGSKIMYPPNSDCRGKAAAGCLSKNLSKLLLNFSMFFETELMCSQYWQLFCCENVKAKLQV